MRLIYTTPPKRQPSHLDVDVAGILFHLRPAHRAGRLIYIASVPSDLSEERLEGLRAFAAASGGRYELDGEGERPAQVVRPVVVETIVTLDKPRERLPGLSLADAAPLPVAMALRNGWTMADLTGGGREGDWGPSGGFGMRSALTIAQLALTVPPPGWSDEIAEGAYPWEIEGWTPPPGFTPPQVPSRKRKAPEPVLSASVVGEQESHGEAPPDAPPDTGAPEEEEAPADPPTGEESDEGEPTGEPDPDWTEERIASARVLLAKLTEESGKAPNASKAKFHLKRQNFPPVSKAILGRLLKP